MSRFTFNSRPFLMLSLILTGLLACNGEDSPPDDLIPQEKMAEILTEIHIAEARVTNMQLRSQDSSILLYEKMQKRIWEKNKVDTSVYRKSYSFYTTHPALLSEIYEQVEKNMEVREKKKNIKL
ncbi:DUF4296 domain-containing protein [Persicitalea jodogahamensis]|uniref:DUF4296 domain-containing protein n=1 Tax=Persicitalea jodogahamensis TaxID=402147 RepID=A0A8J3DA61_9BACT|nr:DUF4296 domain-containing protein [Persicitalea jodogahamensis]GHB67827.1 hypothetical protein GCM10007390_21440 [Persicitalea jodogahamensis]